MGLSLACGLPAALRLASVSVEPRWRCQAPHAAAHHPVRRPAGDAALDVASAVGALRAAAGAGRRQHSTAAPPKPAAGLAAPPAAAVRSEAPAAPAAAAAVTTSSLPRLCRSDPTVPCATLQRLRAMGQGTVVLCWWCQQRDNRAEFFGGCLLQVGRQSGRHGCGGLWPAVGPPPPCALPAVRSRHVQRAW